MNADEIVSKIRVARLLKQPWEPLVDQLKLEKLDQPDENGNYPMHEICAATFPLVEFAVERNASLNVLNPEGYAPLAISVARDDFENVKSLLNLGARLDIVDRLGNTPLLSAIIRGPKGYKIAEMLFVAGCDPDVKNVNGISAKSLAKEIDHPLAERM